MASYFDYRNQDQFGIPDYTNMFSYGMPSITPSTSSGYNPYQSSMPAVPELAPVRDAIAIPTSFMDKANGTMTGFNKTLQDWGVTGGKDAQGNAWNGWGGLALGTAQGLANAFLGMKQYGLMKDQLAFSKENAERNFNAQKNMVNSQLEDRQNRRVADGLMPNVTPTADYMKKYGVA